MEDMDLLYTVRRLAEARAATRPPPSRPPPRISVRERTAQALASAEAEVHTAAHLQERYGDASCLAELRALSRRRRERERRLTPREATDACWALLDASWDSDAVAADRPESDSELDDDPDVEEYATRLNARSRALWASHVSEDTMPPTRYVEGWPVRLVAPTVRRRAATRARGSGLPRCGACAAQGLERCSRMSMGRRVEDERCEVCERCERMGESCLTEEGWEEGERRRGAVMDVVGSRVVEVQRGRFAPPKPKDEEEDT